jgi:hypothetical protein
MYRQVKNQSDLQQSWHLIRASFTGPSLWMILLTVLLMLLQWGIEARKWQLLASHIQPVTFGAACRSVLSGQALAFNTPNRLGEPVGRVVFLGEGNRLRGLALSLVGSGAQLILTFVVGVAALAFFRAELYATPVLAPGINRILVDIALLCITVISVVMLVAYYRLAWFIRWLEKWPVVARHSYLVSELEHFSPGELTRILILSALRYVLFVVQYMILLQLFEVKIGAADAAMMVCVLFLILAIIPTIAFAELGFRGSLGLQLFGMFSSNALGIIAATAGIWIINLLLPAVAGAVFLLGLRLFRLKKDTQ